MENSINNTINFIASKNDNDEERLMHSKRSDMEIMANYETEEVYQIYINITWKKTMKGSEFVFNYVDSWYYQSHEINLNPGGSYTDSHDWMKKPEV